MYLKNKIISLLFRVFGSKAYTLAFIKNIVYSNVSLGEDLHHNEKIFKKLSWDKDDIQKKLKKDNHNYYDHDISWHYHIFSGMSLNSKKLKILEIGTHDARFSSFISNLFTESEIFTIYLPLQKLSELSSLDWIKGSGYEDEDRDKKKFKEFIELRNKNLNKKNIKFIEMNSNDLLKKFEKNTFDLIWIDGDHLKPQVENDINNSIVLSKHNGIICCDDIVFNEYQNNFANSDSYKVLKKNALKLKTNYFIKRIRRSNYDYKKYISYSTVLK